ncbi:FeoA family protein [Peptococcus simiae]|uniref:FeoA family protein n=1 Tax=Peptococcus simiae TaxID=1643805 RepID=A0ABW9GWR6_9FIRM
MTLKTNKTCTLSELQEGTLGEIVAIDNEGIFEQIGAHVGMTVVVLKRAVASLIQIGTGQLEVPQEICDHIRVVPLVSASQ